MMPAAVIRRAARNIAPVETEARSTLTGFIFESSVIRFPLFSQTQEALTSVALPIPAVFDQSVTKKPHIALNARPAWGLSQGRPAPYIAVARPRYRFERFP